MANSRKDDTGSFEGDGHVDLDCSDASMDVDRGQNSSNIIL